MNIDKNNFEDHLKKLKSQYAQQLPQKISALIPEWESLQQEWTKEKATLFHRNIHSLIGTSGTFGFIELSKKARELETQLKGMQTQTTITSTEVVSINAHIAALVALAKQSHTPSTQNTNMTKVDANIEEIIQDQQDSFTSISPLIYYLDDDIAASMVLIENLRAYGFKATHFKHSTELLAAIEQATPTLVLFDLIMPDLSEQKVFELIQRLTQKSIKVFVLSSKADFHSRLAAVRSGANAYIAKPADIPALINTIRNELNLNIQKKAHILIIDDQENILEHYSTLLLAAGMGVSFTNNPLETLEKLEQHRPDLILLDINMPLVSGYELAGVIRQFEEYQSIPILFLSAETSNEKKSSLLELGSDDLLSKDMPPLEFVRQIRSRVERAKILSSFMYEDSLTGLLNHAQIQLAAERSLAQAKRYKRSCSIAMIDIDDFKHINDTYGHPTGDKVIKALAQLLQQRLRNTDYIGRYGGEEFMLVLTETAIQDAGNIVNELRKAFKAIEFIEKEMTFTVSFSAGIAENREEETTTTLIQRADAALYRSKTSGKNRVCVQFQ